MKLKKQTLRELTAFLVVGAAICAVMVLVGCSTAPQAAAPAPATSEITPTSSPGVADAAGPSKSFAPATPAPEERPGLNKWRSQWRVDVPATPAPEERPGLGTGWGDRVSSALTSTTFTRASSRPLGDVGVIYYNDSRGVEAMAGPYKNKTSGLQLAANGAVEWGVKSGWGYADHAMAGGKRYVVGKKGRKYSLVVRNLSNRRLEAVLSVDGLDVMDGKAASFSKRGYILAPGEVLEVKGFRTSFDAVAAFEFATVSASYSNLRHGTTRDVGVIGLAVFSEKGSLPWSGPGQDRFVRKEASPFAEAPMRVGR